MGTQQLLLVVVGIIITAVAIAVGIQLFGSSSIGANRDALVNDINNIAAGAKAYRSKLRSMGGGGGSYVGYNLPSQLASNENGSVSLTISAASVVVSATSALGFGTVEATVDSTGAAGNWTYTGEFQ